MGALLVLLLLAAVSAAPVEAAYSGMLKRYPYLTDVVGASATINWATDRSSSSASVRYGEVADGSCTTNTQPATSTSISVNSVNEYQWKARLAVEPDTEYCYRVFLGASTDLLGSDPAPHFMSQIPAGSPEPYKFVVFGDWGSLDANDQNTNQAALHQLIANSGARFAVTAGDNLHSSGSQTEYGDLVYSRSRVFAPSFWGVPGRSIPIFPTIGNHGFQATHQVNFPQDQAVASSGGRYSVETRCCINGTTSQDDPSSWYAFDAGNARFYVLEAAWPRENPGNADIYANDYGYHWTPSSDEYQWLENDLATHPSQLKFAAFHFPLYDDMSAQHSDPYLQGLSGLEGLLSRYGVDIAFTGHAHTYERNLKTQSYGLVNYVTGGGGADPPVSVSDCSSFDAYAIGWSDSSQGSSCRAPRPTARDQLFHYLLVSVDGTSVTVTPTNRLGQTFDAVSYTFPDEAARADLSMQQADSPDPVTGGTTLTYTLTAQNDGPDDATSTTVTDTLPAGVSFQSASASQGSCSQSAGVVTCDLGTLASGASTTITVRVVPGSAGTLTNSASMSAAVTDPDPSDNSATESTTVLPGSAAADLSVTGSDSPDPVGAGQSLTYTFTVGNGGPSPATGVTFTDTLPDGVDYSSATPSQGSCSPPASGALSCNLGSLAGGTAAAVRIDVVPQAFGTISDEASVTGNEADPSSSNNDTTVTTEVLRLSTFTPSADAHVRSDQPAANFGAQPTVEVDNSPVKNILFKFAISGIASDTVVSAKLRLFNTNASPAGGDFYPVADTTWSESTVTWNNAPAADATRLASLGAVSPNNWYEADVTPLVTGDGLESLRVTSPSSDGADYSSREGANPPQLVVLSRPSMATGYPRPKGATPLHASLVPAYARCTSANTAHGSPFANPACKPPVPTSTRVTVGTPDANGAPASSVGFFRLKVRTNPSPTPNDVGIDVGITDVRCTSVVSRCGAVNLLGGPDYVGELQATYALRVTDRFNGSGAGTAATVVDTVLPITIACAETADDQIGGTCATSTSANAIMSGSVRTGDRAVWEIGQVQVFDGGPDGLASTADNALFATEGIFSP